MGKAILVFLLLCLLGGMAWAQDYEVTVAGTAAYNDTYTVGVGLWNDRPWYEGDTNGMFLFNAVITLMGNNWVLDDTKQAFFAPVAADYYYFALGAQATPPLGSYTTGAGDAPDAYVVEYGFTDAIARRTNVRMIFTGCNARLIF